MEDEFRAFIETSYFLDIFTFNKVKNDQELPFLTLLFDKMYMFGDFSIVEPKDSFEQPNLFEIMKVNENTNYDNIANPYGEDDKNDRSMLLAHSSISFCYAENIYFLVRFDLQSNFIDFCRKVEPKYVEKLKEGFLFFNIANFIKEEFFPNILIDTSNSKIKALMPQLRIGINELLQQFKGSYRLNDEQKDVIKKGISLYESRLLHTLDAEKLRSIYTKEFGKEMGTDVGCTIAETLAAILSGGLPIPLGIFYNIIKRIYDVFRFDKNLSFAFSILALKSLVNKGVVPDIIKCDICNMTLDEINDLTDDEADKIALSQNRCIDDLVYQLSIRKESGLTGRELLKEIKKRSNK